VKLLKTKEGEVHETCRRLGTTKMSTEKQEQKLRKFESEP
jgi:hypothetical protein